MLRSALSCPLPPAPPLDTSCHHHTPHASSIKNRLLPGSLFFDGPVLAFNELASLYYQVDVALAPTPPPYDGEGGGREESAGGLSPPARALMAALAASSAPPLAPRAASASAAASAAASASGPPAAAFSVERAVEYSPRLLRLTFAKAAVPLSALWAALAALKAAGRVERCVAYLIPI